MGVTAKQHDRSTIRQSAGQAQFKGLRAGSGSLRTLRYRGGDQGGRTCGGLSFSPIQRRNFVVRIRFEHEQTGFYSGGRQNSGYRAAAHQGCCEIHAKFASDFDGFDGPHNGGSFGRGVCAADHPSQ